MIYPNSVSPTPYTNKKYEVSKEEAVSLNKEISRFANSPLSDNYARWHNSTAHLPEANGCTLSGKQRPADPAVTVSAPQKSLKDFVGSSYFSNYRHNCTLKKGDTKKKRKKPRIKWTTAQKRCFFRAKSGCKVHSGMPLRHMALSTAPNMKRDKAAAFRALKERMKRMTPNRLRKEGYIPATQLPFYYPDRDYFRKLKMDYHKITTTEGPNGVFHILWFGDYIPQGWVSSVWYELLNPELRTAHNVDMRLIKNRRGGSIRVAQYVVSQYVTNQNSDGVTSYVRFSNSWSWCFKGFIGEWYSFKEAHRSLDYDKVYSLWDNYIWLKTHPPPMQTCLSVGFVSPLEPYDSSDLYTYSEVVEFGGSSDSDIGFRGCCSCADKSVCKMWDLCGDSKYCPYQNG